MLCTIPLAFLVFPKSQCDTDQSQKHGGMMKLLKLPSILVLCIVIVIVSNTWGFLDPTLEPHLREVMVKNYLLHDPRVGLELLTKYYNILSAV